MVDDKLIERVKKLLALATSSNPHEAAAALAKAQALMAEHNISIGKLAASELGDAKVDSKSSVGSPKDYEVHLCSAIASAFGCRLLSTKGDSWVYKATGGRGGWTSFTFIGTKSGVQVAEHVAIVMLRKLRQARAEFVKTTASKSAAADAFCLGWAEGVRKHVAALAIDATVAAAINDMVEERTKGRKAKTQQSSLNDARAFHDGVRRGSEERLHRPVGASSEAPRLIGKE